MEGAAPRRVCRPGRRLSNATPASRCALRGRPLRRGRPHRPGHHHPRL